MPRKLIIVAEAGIDAAVAIAAALIDPNLDVLLVAGVAGVEPPEATDQCLHALVEQIDPPRLPRYGAAPPRAAAAATGSWPKQGLGKSKLNTCGLHHPRSAEKLIAETVHQQPGEVTVLALGPLTTLALAFDRDRELPRMLKSLILVGGVGSGPGNLGANIEFHFGCDPCAARQVLQVETPKTLIPLEISQSILFAPTELNTLTQGGSAACRVLRTLLPLGIHNLAQEQGLEGLYLPDIFGVACAANPGWFKSKPVTADVETRGELTCGMVVLDNRRVRKPPNVDWTYEADTAAVRGYLLQTLNGG